MRAGEQPRDLVSILVAQLLADPLIGRNGGRLHLDHDQRNAVDEQHDVGPAGIGGALALHRELGRQMEDVVRWGIPIDEA